MLEIRAVGLKNGEGGQGGRCRRAVLVLICFVRLTATCWPRGLVLIAGTSSLADHLPIDGAVGVWLSLQPKYRTAAIIVDPATKTRGSLFNLLA